MLRDRCPRERIPVDADQIMRAADAAMYEAKRKGKSRYAIHTPAFHSPLYAGSPAST